MKKPRKKYYKVVLLIPKTITIIKKRVYVNVDKCFVKKGVVCICRDGIEYEYNNDTHEFFIKEQRGRI